MTQCVTRITETNLNVFSVPSEARFINLSRALTAQRGKNRIASISRDLLGVRSWCPPVSTSGCILGFQATLLQVRMQMLCTAMFYSKCVSLRPFTVKACFSPKSVPLNLCYTEAYHLWIGSFPADRCDRLITSKTGFSITHPSAVEPESESRPKWCKMDFKYAFKLLFLKCIFEFMINTAPPTAEKNALSITILVVKDPISHIGDTER